MNSPVVLPAGIFPGYLTTIGTLNASSYPPTPFSSRNGWFPSSGQLFEATPLLLEFFEVRGPVAFSV